MEGIEISQSISFYVTYFVLEIMPFTRCGGDVHDTYFNEKHIETMTKTVSKTSICYASSNE